MIATLSKPVLVGLWLAASGSALPRIDIAKACAATSASPSDRADCQRDEAQARAKLRQQWPTLPRAIKGQCLIEPLPPSPSYMVLEDCVSNALLAGQGGGADAPPDE